MKPYYPLHDQLSIVGNDYKNLIFATFSNGLLQLQKATAVKSDYSINWIRLLNRVVYKMSYHLLPCQYYKQKQITKRFYVQVQDKLYRKSNIVSRRMVYDTCKLFVYVYNK